MVTTADLPRPDLPRADLPRADLPRADLQRLGRGGPDRLRADLHRDGAGPDRPGHTCSAGPELSPPAAWRSGPLRCPSCAAGLLVLEVLGDLRFRCERCVLEWRYGLGQLWTIGDGLGDTIP